jgi:Tol biopolymer transport system component
MAIRKSLMNHSSSIESLPVDFKSASIKSMSPVKIEYMMNIENGKVMSAKNGNMNVKPVTNPRDEANNGRDIYLSSYSNTESFTFFLENVLVIR